MGLRNLLLGSSRFGHFAGAAAATAPAAAEDDEEAKRTAAKKAAEEEADAKRKARRARKARKAKGSGQGDDDDDEDGDEAADDDEDGDDEDEMKKAASAGHALALDAAFRAGARAQRRRCTAIFAHKAAATNPVLAMSLAFETTMAADVAIGVLERTPAAAAPARGSLAERMATSASASLRVPPSAPEGPRGTAAVAASWDHALKDYAPAR